MLSAIVVQFDRFTRLNWYLSGAALSFVLLSYIYEVAARYLFNAPTSWSSDANELFLAATVMLALPEVTRVRGHIVIGFFLEKMDSKKRERASRINYGVCFVVCSLVALICLKETCRQYASGIETMWYEPIPKWWLSSLLPYGFGLTALQMLKVAAMPGEEE
jgi:C4-dicarboxylate transporter DctQ subunit